MEALIICRCSYGKHTKNTLKLIKTCEEDEVVAEVGDISITEKTTTYVFSATCSECGYSMPITASDEEEMDMILDLILPYALHWILPENIYSAPVRKRLTA